MGMFKFVQKPEFAPPLDGGYRPAVLANRAYLDSVRNSGQTVSLAIAVVRVDGSISRYETSVFADGHLDAAENLYYAERIVKFLLWQRGGWKMYIGGSKTVGAHIAAVYAADGARSFDYEFMTRVYTREFEVVNCAYTEVPQENERQLTLGGHLEGNRIGFDLGASDLKVSAVVNGETIFSTEIEWQPVEQTDPAYHDEKIRAALDLAASKMEHVDAIGGSSAGVYINNRPMVASLYRGIPDAEFGRIHEMFINIQKDKQIPLEIVNDGEVTALAGAMSLEEGGVLGIAMGSSEATGYVTPAGKITDWLNELAFAPMDYNEQAPVDEWSGDRGNGALYFSQQCVFRLAPQAGIEIPDGLTNAKKLKFVQKKLEADDPGAVQIWESMGVYLGYTIAHYADFYDINHVLILGRCTSGKGGPMILEGANAVLQAEFPELAAQINIQLPDEKSRRVGQSIAAASLPELEG